jgi:hypothetical protein
MYVALIVRRIAEDRDRYNINLFTTEAKAINHHRHFAIMYFNDLLKTGYLSTEHNNNKLEKHTMIKDGQRVLKSVNIGTLEKLFEKFTYGEYKWYITNDLTPQ